METNKYIQILVKKRDQDIPEAVAELQARIQHLLLEKNNTDLEIQHLEKTGERKTIFELPFVTWTTVAGMFIHPENELSSLCLASPKFCDIIKAIVPEKWMFFRNAKKMFSVLLSNFYLDKQDLLNCVNTGSDNLGMIASASWRFLPAATFEIIKLESEESSIYFYYKVRESKTWAAFVGKSFIFTLRQNTVYIWKLLKEFGEYFLNIRFVIQEEMEGLLLKSLRMIISGKLPNVQYFHVRFYEKSVLGLDAKLGHLTLYLKHRLYTFSSKLFRKEIFELTSQITQTWSHNSSVYHGTITFKVLKHMFLNYSLNAEMCNSILREQQDNISQVNKLLMTPCWTIPDPLEFPRNFPNLSEVILNLDNFSFLPYISNIPFPRVRKLSYIWSKRSPLVKLHDLLSPFPHLSCFNIKTYLITEDFEDTIKKSLEREGRASRLNHRYDVYHLISDGESLAVSNIWNLVEHLKLLTVTTSTTKLPYPSTLLIQRYMRFNKNRVVLETFFKSRCEGFPFRQRDS